MATTVNFGNRAVMTRPSESISGIPRPNCTSVVGILERIAVPEYP